MRWFAIVLLMVAAGGVIAFAVYQWKMPSIEPGASNSATPEDPGLAFATPHLNVRPEVKYVGDKKCAGCHVTEAETYRHHPMGRSLAPIAEVAQQQLYDRRFGNPFASLGFQFQIEHHGGSVVHKELARDAAGKVIAETAAPIHYAVGSGTHAYSYLIQRDGILYQSPVSWFSQKKMWDLSPGFAEQHYRFERPILPGCLFCHCNYAEAVPGTSNTYRQPIFAGYTIGCERCHGPGELHVALQESGKTGEDNTIVNPRKLTATLREAVCEQCHLAGTARVLRRGRGAFDFRPGLPLDQFWTIFVLPPEKSHGNRVAGHVEQMHASRCFQASAGQMGCITCHNPHVLPSQAEAEKYYRDRCQACHAEHGCSVPIAVRRQTSPTDNCVSCHMPQGDTDITHVALTDHRILRKAESKASTQANTTNLSRQEGLLSFHRDKLDVGDAELMRDLGVMLMEQARMQASSERLTAARMALPLLEQAVQQHADDSAACDGLELALGFQEYMQKALSVCEETLRTAPRREWTLTDAAMICQSLGKNEESFAYWKRALEINPWSSRYRYEVARQLAAQREWQKAATECIRVLRYNGSHIESRMLLVRCLLQRGEKDQASAEMERVLALRPRAAENLQRNIDQLLQELEHAANPGK